MTQRTLTIVALVAIIILAATSAVSITVAIQRGRKIESMNVTLAAAEAAEKARKEKADEIEKTDPSALVGKSPRAEDLGSARDDLADGLADAVRTRAREILSGGSGGAAP